MLNVKQQERLVQALAESAPWPPFLRLDVNHSVVSSFGTAAMLHDHLLWMYLASCGVRLSHASMASRMVSAVSADTETMVAKSSSQLLWLLCRR